MYVFTCPDYIVFMPMCTFTAIEHLALGSVNMQPIYPRSLPRKSYHCFDINECHFCLRLNVTFRVLRVATQFSCRSSPKFLDSKLNLRDLR